MYIYAGAPHALEQEVNSEVKNKVNTHITLDEACTIVDYLYCPEDAARIKKVLELKREFLEEQKGLGTREQKIVDRYRTATPVIGYKDFRRIVTDFVFESHMEYLQPFKTIFRKFDTDQNGVLNEVGPDNPRQSSAECSASSWHTAPSDSTLRTC